MHPVRVGCSGWQYDSCAGAVPGRLGEGRWLERYAQVRHRRGQLDLLQAGLERRGRALDPETPPDFVFAAKASRYMTHIRRLQNLAEGIGRYYEGIEPLVESGKLGPIVWQFPANFKRDDDRLGRSLPLLPPGRHCFEFRDESWFAEPVYKMLRAHGAALVIGDHPRWPFQAHERSPPTGRSSASTMATEAGAATTSATELTTSGPSGSPTGAARPRCSSTSTTTGGLRRGERLGHAAVAADSTRLSARRRRRDTCICE